MAKGYFREVWFGEAEIFKNIAVLTINHKVWIMPQDQWKKR